MDYFYLPGCNANLFVIRREKNYDVNGHGNGAIDDQEVTAERAYNAVKSFPHAMAALKHAKDELAALNKSRNIFSHSQAIIADALKLMNGEDL